MTAWLVYVEGLLNEAYVDGEDDRYLAQTYRIAAGTAETAKELAVQKARASLSEITNVTVRFDTGVL